MLIFLTLLLSLSGRLADGAACTTSNISPTGTWSTVQDGAFKFTVPIATSSWDLVITYDKPITDLKTWNGISKGCTSGGRICTYSNAGYNAIKTQGDYLSLGYQIWFASTSVSPKVVSLSFNGQSICSNDNVVTTTTPSSGGTSQCDSSKYSYSAQQWSGLIDGNFYIQFPRQVNGWKITVQFASNVNSLSVWDGSNIICSGAVCSFGNKNYNNNQQAGARLTFGFQVYFNGAQPPKVVSISVDNFALCSGSGGQSTQAPITTTTAPTNRPPLTTTTSRAPATGRCADYNDLIRMSLLFYEAQRSGKLPSDQRVTWRKDSALTDRGNRGEDLTGGYYDAGDYVKFGFPMASAITILAWGGIAYPEGYKNSGQTNYLLDAVKWGTDYFIKCHVSPNEFYGQVGNATADHDIWVRPQDMAMPRPAWSITPTKPGSDLAGETAAAMAAASILFKAQDPVYSATLLSHAKDLFTFADKYKGKYSDSILDAKKFYPSYSGYEDELVWAALWLFKATGIQYYLTYAIQGYSSNGFSGITEPLSWDLKVAGIKILMAQSTSQATYIQDAVKLCEAHISLPRSPKGQAFYLQWGSLRYSANAAFICLLASDLNVQEYQKTSFQAFAVSQMEYILSSTGRSFVVGFGNNYPKRTHHASSSCPVTSATCNLNSPDPNPNLLQGALVGGPDARDDLFNDIRTDYTENEVTMDYNAGFQSLLAGLRKKAC